MHLQQAIARQLALTTGSTYAALEALVTGAGARVFWALTAKNQNPPYVWLRKASRQPLANAMKSGLREPAMTVIEVTAVTKNQADAATLADAVTTDMLATAGLTPSESPPPSGQVYVQRIDPGNEEDVVTEDTIELGLAGEMRSFNVFTRTA